MSNNINFVSGKSLDFEKQFKTLKILRITAFVSLLLVALISGLFFVLTLFLPLSSVKKEQEQTLLGISALHKKLVNVALVSERITNINDLIEKRKGYPLILEGIFKEMPDELFIDKLEIDGTQLKIKIRGNSLISINQFIDYFITHSSKSKQIKGLVVENLMFIAGSSQYEISFSTEIVEK